MQMRIQWMNERSFCLYAIDIDKSSQETHNIMWKVENIQEEIPLHIFSNLRGAQ